MSDFLKELAAQLEQKLAQAKQDRDRAALAEDLLRTVYISIEQDDEWKEKYKRWEDLGKPKDPDVH